MIIRSFVALEIPGEALDNIIEIRDGYFRTEEKIRWEPKNKIHLTLKFLGDTDENIINDVSSEIDKIAAGNRALSLKFSNFGTFRKDNKPRILWVGISENMNLLKLYNELEISLEKCGFRKEGRRFNPHLTLLRIKGDEDFNKIYAFTKINLPVIEFQTVKIMLIKSELKPAGSIYTELKSFYLNK